LPVISRFYGIVIKMYFKPDEHEPSHIHAIYGEYIGQFNIKTFEMIRGDLPNKARKLVTEWMKKYQTELNHMWETQNVTSLPPLI